MRNYPEIIKNLRLTKELNDLANDLDRCGFIVRGTISDCDDLVIFKQSNGGEESLNNVKHNGYVFLPNREEKELLNLNRTIEKATSNRTKITNIFLPISVGFLAISLVTSSPFFTAVWAVSIASDISYKTKINKLQNLLELDMWFANNKEKVDEKIREGQTLYERLSPRTKEILSRPGFEGQLCLNNIEEFPLSDLNMIRKTITVEEEKERKARIKKYKKIRGM